MKLSLFFCLLSIFFSSHSFAIGLNDASILLPLPKTQELNLMLSPFETGKKGTLLSKEVFDEIFELVPEYNNQIIWKDQLKVVAIRFDPCFIEGLGPLSCRHQMRLVWQPVITEGSALTTRDAAIHSFYEFSSVEYAEVLKEWRQWAKTEKSSPLSIHPIIQKEGLSGAHWKTLKSMILKFCGSKNIIRMTSMTVLANEQLWIFSGFDITPEGKSREMVIPRVNSATQTITQTSFDFKTFTGGMTPAPDDDMEFFLLTEDSNWFKKMYKDVHIKKAIRSAFNFENPKKHNTGTLDCASCHLANMANQWAQANFPRYDWDNEFSDVKYVSEFNLTNPTKNEVRPNQFRIFGYFKSEPAVSQRVINETSEALKLLTVQ